MPLKCIKCQSDKSEPTKDMDFFPYPAICQMKCVKCGTEYNEQFLMNQKILKEKGKTSVFKVNPDKPDRNCPKCDNVHVTVVGGTEGIDAGRDSIGVQIHCEPENGGCGAKYEENYYLNKLFDPKTNKEIKLEQRKLDDLPDKVKKVVKKDIIKPITKAVKKIEKSAKTGSHPKNDLVKNPVKPKGSVDAANKYIKSNNDKLIQKRIHEREQRRNKK